MRGLESEGVEWGAELRELRFQAAWRNTQWDCELAERCGHAAEGTVQSSIRWSLFLQLCLCFYRGENSKPGFHESMFCSLQALRDKEFSIFDEMMKQARYGGHLRALNTKSSPSPGELFTVVVALQGCRGGRAVQRQSGSRVLSVPGSQEPAEPQGAGECQTTIF